MIALQRARRMYLDNEAIIGLVCLVGFIAYLWLRHA